MGSASEPISHEGCHEVGKPSLFLAGGWCSEGFTKGLSKIGNTILLSGDGLDVWGSHLSWREVLEGIGAPLTHKLLEPKVEASYPGQERWLRDYCASGLYILVLLLEGYKFSEETWTNIQFQKQVTATESPSMSGSG